MLARAALRRVLGEKSITPVEKTLIDNVVKRVRLWNDIGVYTPSKESESRGTESILNAFVLVSNDAVSNKAPAGHLGPDAKLALDNMWALQLKTGAWNWFEFHLAPWESDSQFYGATLAAIAIGSAPDNYQSAPGIQNGLRMLRTYLINNRNKQTPADRVMLLWASTKLHGLLAPAQQTAIVNDILARQSKDGGYSMAALQGPWKKSDNTALDTASDGYATGLVAFALEQVKAPKAQPQLKSALAWLVEHQNGSDGRWPALSLNETRTLDSDAGLFMSDAATAYAVLALENAPVH